MQSGWGFGRSHPGFVRTIVAYDFQHTALFVGGAFRRWLAPGIHRIWGRGVLTATVERRTRYVVVPLQELLTKDGAGVRVSAAAGYAVVDPDEWLLRHENAEGELYAALQLAVRDAVCARTLIEVADARIELARDAESSARPRLAALGVELATLELRDVAVLGELKKAMGAILAAELEAKASLERARGEAATLRSLANTARLLDANPNLYALRLLQSVERAPGAKIVLPAPERSASTEA